MTTVDVRPTTAPAESGLLANATWKAFNAILWRDIFVTGKEFWVLLAQTAVTPLFMLFIFAKVLGSMNYVSDAYGHLLLPGIVALSTFLTALQSVAFPLVMEFGWTKEIEDRLLAPLPTTMVALEKLVVASHRAQLTDVTIGEPSLEDVFIALTGRALR